MTVYWTDWYQPQNMTITKPSVSGSLGVQGIGFSASNSGSKMFLSGVMGYAQDGLTGHQITDGAYGSPQYSTSTMGYHHADDESFPGDFATNLSDTNPLYSGIWIWNEVTNPSNYGLGPSGDYEVAISSSMVRTNVFPTIMDVINCLDTDTTLPSANPALLPPGATILDWQWEHPIFSGSSGSPSCAFVSSQAEFHPVEYPYSRDAAGTFHLDVYQWHYADLGYGEYAMWHPHGDMVHSWSVTYPGYSFSTGTVSIATPSPYPIYADYGTARSELAIAGDAFAFLPREVYDGSAVATDFTSFMTMMDTASTVSVVTPSRVKFQLNVPETPNLDGDLADTRRFFE